MWIGVGSPLGEESGKQGRIHIEEIKLFASTFLAGVASGFQQLQTQSTAFGVTQIVTGTGRNAGLQGTADVLNV